METILAVHKDGDNFEVTYSYDGTECFDVFRSIVALVFCASKAVGLTPEQVVADVSAFIAEGHSGFLKDLNRDN